MSNQKIEHGDMSLMLIGNRFVLQISRTNGTLRLKEVDIPNDWSNLNEKEQRATLLQQVVENDGIKFRFESRDPMQIIDYSDQPVATDKI